MMEPGDRLALLLGVLAGLQLALLGLGPLIAVGGAGLVGGVVAVVVTIRRVVGAWRAG